MRCMASTWPSASMALYRRCSGSCPGVKATGMRVGAGLMLVMAEKERLGLGFTDDLARGIAALRPRLALLYPPHEKFHEMMGVTSRPDHEFVAAAKAAAPEATVLVLRPGSEVDLASGALSTFAPAAVDGRKTAGVPAIETP